MQKEKLVRDMRMAEETLKTDYPSHSFQIVDGVAKPNGRRYGIHFLVCCRWKDALCTVSDRKRWKEDD